MSRTTPEALAQVKPLIARRPGSTGPPLELSAYLYGDDDGRAHGTPRAASPYCAGYACGYHLVRRFLDETGADIAEATFLPAADILDAAAASGSESRGCRAIPPEGSTLRPRVRKRRKSS